jgi:predicted RNase H-like HicB family nuclease
MAPTQASEVIKMKQFTLEYWMDESWYVGRLMEIPGVFSQGETLEELKSNIQDAYRMLMDTEDISIIPPSAERITLELAI